MPNSELLARLRSLHQDLEGINQDLDTTEPIDDETIRALGQIVTDVGGIVDRTKHVVTEQFVNDEERNELQNRIMQFNSQHPQISKFLSELTDVLAMMGI